MIYAEGAEHRCISSTACTSGLVKAAEACHGHAERIPPHFYLGVWGLGLQQSAAVRQQCLDLSRWNYSTATQDSEK